MANTEIVNGRLAGKVALITGAGSGIGRACSTRFIHEGARVIAVDLEKPDLNFGPSFIPISGDVTNSNSCESMLHSALDKFGQVDILVNSAGVSARNALPENSNAEEIWDKVIEVNLKGTYLPSWYVVPEMKKTGGGSIINLASIMGLVGYPVGLGGGFNAYPPSKGGVVQFTKTLATDLARENIRVNCIAPSLTKSKISNFLLKNEKIAESIAKMHPLKRLGEGSDSSSVANFLLSDNSSWITGQILGVDGGRSSLT